MSGLGTAMAGGNPAAGRNENEFYPTVDTNVTEGLLQRVSFGNRKIHECACGDGRMAEVIKAYGYDVISTDKFDYGYGTPGVDFLEMKEAVAPIVITNPPFDQAQEFVEHGMGTLGLDGMALLLKSTWYHAACRATDFRKRFPPVVKFELTWRVDFNGKGRPTMECAWFIWRKGFTGKSSFAPMHRPVASRLKAAI